MSRTHLLWGILISTLIGAALFPASSPPLPHYGEAPDFVLTDQAGIRFDKKSLAGKIWIVDFIFTSCGGQCPQMTAQMKTLQDRLPADVSFLSVTVDPARDTPAVLARYAAGSGADPKRWHFVTGDRTWIERLSKEGFHLPYAEGGTAQEPVTHSSRFVLVDRRGSIRGYYDGTDPQSVKQLLLDSKKLVKER